MIVYKKRSDSFRRRFKMNAIIVLVVILLMVAITVIFTTTFTNPSKETPDNKLTIHLEPLQSIYISDPYHPGGKTIFMLEASADGITQISEIAIYFTNGFINTSFGNSKFNGKLFNVSAYALPHNYLKYKTLIVKYGKQYFPD